MYIEIRMREGVASVIQLEHYNRMLVKSLSTVTTIH